jgi:hypothetical protein
MYRRVNSDEVVGGSQSVVMITLADLMNQEAIARCDYLKLDCEGAEHDIVASLTADVANRISQITLELHKVESKDPARLAQKLSELGYSRVGRHRLSYYRCQPQGFAA